MLNLLRSVPELIMGIISLPWLASEPCRGTRRGPAFRRHDRKILRREHRARRSKAVEAARAAGASSFQVIWHAVLPQVMPQLADTTIYRWEYNFRASTVLGAVGAGGIGFELIAALRVLEYAQVSAILICILICVTIVDGIGAALRNYLR